MAKFAAVMLLVKDCAATLARCLMTKSRVLHGETISSGELSSTLRCFTTELSLLKKTGMAIGSPSGS